VTQKKSPDPEASEGWESLVEESEGALAPSEELEQAMREAAEAIEAQRADASPATPKAPEGEADPSGDELSELQDRYLRLAADFDNFRRRALREREEAHQFGHQNLVKDLLGTVARAIEHARQSEAGDLEGLLQGVELVERELLATLAKHGLGVIHAEGERFDPSVHEAMAQVEDESAQEGTVKQVLQRGYVLRDRLLRAARVMVTKRPADADKASGGEPGTS
jgi:molecular chaperone GrpE